MLDLDLILKLAVRPGPSGRFLERVADSTPFFIQADTAWQLCHRLTREEALHYLDTRAAQGFNVVFTVLLPELDNRSVNGVVFGPDGVSIVEADKASERSMFYPNRYGEVPLINDDPKQPNAKYFEHVDWVIQQAAVRDILVAVVPTWSKYVNKGWSHGPVLFDEESVRSYGAFIGQRYPMLPKLLGGDSNPHWLAGGGADIWKRWRAGGRDPLEEPLPRLDDLPTTETHALWDAMAEGILSTELALWEGHGRPLITYHPTAVWLPSGPQAIASAFFPDRDWLTLDGSQSGHADFPNLPFRPAFGWWDSRSSHAPVRKMWETKPARPIIDLESHYEDLHNALDAKQGWKWAADDIRAGAWQSALSGACGVVYGANAVWQMYDPHRRQNEPHHKPVCGLDENTSWRTSIQLPGASQLRILTDYLLSLPKDVFHHREPAQQLLLANDAPKERADRDARVDVMWDRYPDKAPTTVIAHSGFGYPFELDLRVFNDGIDAEWLDPRTGKRVRIGRLEVSARRRFAPPSTGAVTDDWVLVLTRT